MRYYYTHPFSYDPPAKYSLFNPKPNLTHIYLHNFNLMLAYFEANGNLPPLSCWSVLNRVRRSLLQPLNVVKPSFFKLRLDLPVMDRFYLNRSTKGVFYN